MKFWKYSSAGNDFVIFNHGQHPPVAEIPTICDRRFGVGADGVMIFAPSTKANLDFKMVYFNADGGQVEMCGNGARAMCHFARKFQQISKTELNFETKNGVYSAKFEENDLIKMHMSELGRKELALNDLSENAKYLEVGVPHVVIFEEIFNLELAKKIRHDSRFSEGTNVNFVQQISKGILNIQTFERGVEDETLSCGTGITAAGILFLEENKSLNKVELHARGGDFFVTVENNAYFLTGKTDFIFSGDWPQK